MEFGEQEVVSGIRLFEGAHVEEGRSSSGCLANPASRKKCVDSLMAISGKHARSSSTVGAYSAGQYFMTIRIIRCANALS